MNIRCERIIERERGLRLVAGLAVVLISEAVPGRLLATTVEHVDRRRPRDGQTLRDRKSLNQLHSSSEDDNGDCFETGSLNIQNSTNMFAFVRVKW